ESFLKNPELYKDLRIFTMDDIYERRDEMVKLLYPRSLLYFISGVLEGKKAKHADTPLLGLHRHFRKAIPYSGIPLLDKINEFLVQPDKYNNRVVLSSWNEIDGRRSTALEHGGYTENKETVTSIYHFLNF